MGSPCTRSSRGPAVALAGLLLLAPLPAAAQLRGSLAETPPASGPAATGSLAPVAPAYRIGPVAGAPAGPGIRRVIETFGGWTLICDEEKRRRICNASQSIVTGDAALAFSWSPAATRGGEPVFLLRAPVAEFPSHTVTLDFPGRETLLGRKILPGREILTRLDQCDAVLCLGFLPVDADLAKRIKERASVIIRYRVREGTVPVTMAASLDGLGAAIGSIR